MLPTEVSTYLQGNREKHLAELFELLRIPSVANRKDDACNRAADWLANRLSMLGFHCRLPDAPGRPNVLAEKHVADDAPTVLIYGHYDVQPAEPLELWQSAPFEPEVRDGWIYARGANDDKGQLYAHIMAVEAWMHTAGLPVNVKFFIEGEEEIGSPHVDAFLAMHAAALAADTCLVSDSAFFADGLPSITTALRGLVECELTVTGPSCDLHSGLYGGAVANPINALARLVAAMHADVGRVTLPGFYDDVAEPDEAERRAWAELPLDEPLQARAIGLDALAGGERGRPLLERLWARPTLDANGIVGGYTEQGAKTIIPARASAKLSMRLVANQQPAKIVKALRMFVTDHTPPGVTARVDVRAAAPPVQARTDGPAMDAATAALAEAFGREAVLIRCGASVPVTEVIQRRLGVDPVMMGFGLPDDRLHSPNERFALKQLHGGAHASAAFLRRFACRFADSH